MEERKTSPAVSVALAVYNGEAFLPETLDSVRAQTFQDYELIVIDDGSTDNTAAIVNDYAAHDARVRVFRQPNRGFVTTCNEALQRARGRYVAHLDADDLAHPERFRLQYEYLEAHPQAVVVCSDFYQLYPSGVRVLCQLPRADDELVQRLFAANCIAHSSIMMRTAAARQVGMYSPDWNTVEDYELYFRLQPLGQIHNIPQALTTWRVHEQSISAQHEFEQVRLGVRLRWHLLCQGQVPWTYLRYLWRPCLKALLPRPALALYKRTIRRGRRY